MSHASYLRKHGHKSVNSNAFYQRLYLGWSRKEAASVPLQKRRSAIKSAKRR